METLRYDAAIQSGREKPQVPRKSRDDFKAAFKTVKKPKAPTKDVSSLKTAIDRAIDKGAPENILSGLVKKLLNEDERDYVVDLVAYKYAKHHEDGDGKRPSWTTKFPADIVTEAMEKVVPDGFDTPLTRKTLERAVAGGGEELRRTASVLYERDADGMTDYVIGQVETAAKASDVALAGKWITALYESDADAITSCVLDQVEAAAKAGDPKLAKDWSNTLPVGPSSTALLLFQAADRGDPATMAAVATSVANLIVLPPDADTVSPSDLGKYIATLKGPDRVLDLELINRVAAANPELFAKEVLPQLKGNDSTMLPIIGDTELRALLKRKAGDEWDELVDDIPILSLFDGLEAKIEKDGLDTPDKVAESLFDMVVNNEGIELRYYTNTLYTPGELMLGPNESRQKGFDSLRAGDAGAPDGPASQCSMLTNTIQRMLAFSPGMDPEPTIIQKETPKMAMTVPLGSLKRANAPIKGLLDKSFPGNVFDEAGAPTGQVMFTGSDGMKAHTWLVVNGVAYDSVLGTKGGEVEAAVAEEFRWIEANAFAKGSKGSFLIQVTSTAPAALAAKPKVAANKMGFATAYVLTKSPDTYLSADEKVAFKLAVAKKADHPEDWENKRDDRKS